MGEACELRSSVDTAPRRLRPGPSGGRASSRGRRPRQTPIEDVAFYAPLRTLSLDQGCTVRTTRRTARPSAACASGTLPLGDRLEYLIYLTFFSGVFLCRMMSTACLPMEMGCQRADWEVLLSENNFIAARAHRDALVHQQLQQQQVALHQEQLQFAQYAAQRQELYQVAMWRQTPDGVAYLKWCDQAIALLARLRLMNEVWRLGWIRATESALGRSIIPPDDKMTRRSIQVTAVFVGLVVFFIGFVEYNVDGRALWLVVGAGLLLSALVLKTVRASRIQTARAERTAIFGFDPLEVSTIPLWSAPNANGFNNITHMRAIEWHLGDGGRSFPQLSVLPQIKLPRVGPIFLPLQMHEPYDRIREIAGET